MDDTSVMIRQQMNNTRLQLSEKLESLEHQVSRTVQSTGTAVNATVGAVQETVDSVKGAVNDAAQSVSNAFDLRRQIDRHPWLCVGGSVVLGYLAVKFLTGSAKKSNQPLGTAFPTGLVTDKSMHGNAAVPANVKQAATSAATATDLASAYESGLKRSSWDQLRSVAIGALIAVVQGVASRAVPEVMGYLAGNRDKPNDDVAPEVKQ
jgi:hypothetical protein